jgi:hypothetical protein
MTMDEIFISYKKEELDSARLIADALEAQGWTVWLDASRLRAGEYFDDVIEEAIKKAACVIVVWSGRSITSSYVKKEASLALDLGKLVPVTIDNTRLPLRFRDLHTIQLQGWDGSPFFGAFQELSKNIGDKISRLDASASEDDYRQIAGLRQKLADDLREIEKKYAAKLMSLKMDPWTDSDGKEFFELGNRVIELEEKFQKVAEENFDAARKLGRIAKLGTKCVWHTQRDILVEYEKLTTKMLGPLRVQMDAAKANLQANQQKWNKEKPA